MNTNPTLSYNSYTKTVVYRSGERSDIKYVCGVKLRHETIHGAY